MSRHPIFTAIIIIAGLYVAMLGALHFTLYLQHSIAHGYMQSNCELLGDTKGQWYECTK